jgi:hypothetical protein
MKIIPSVRARLITGAYDAQAAIMVPSKSALIGRPTKDTPPSQLASPGQVNHRRKSASSSSSSNAAARPPVAAAEPIHEHKSENNNKVAEIVSAAIKAAISTVMSKSTSSSSSTLSSSPPASGRELNIDTKEQPKKPLMYCSKCKKHTDHTGQNRKKCPVFQLILLEHPKAASSSSSSTSTTGKRIIAKPSTSSNLSSNSMLSSPPIKRGRGRPRKSSLEPIGTSSNSSSTSTNRAKRQRVSSTRAIASQFSQTFDSVVEEYNTRSRSVNRHDDYDDIDEEAYAYDDDDEDNTN